MIFECAAQFNHDDITQALAAQHVSNTDIERYKLLSEELKRLEAFEAELDTSVLNQMRKEILVLQQYLVTI